MIKEWIVKTFFKTVLKREADRKRDVELARIQHGIDELSRAIDHLHQTFTEYKPIKKE